MAAVKSKLNKLQGNDGSSRAMTRSSSSSTSPVPFAVLSSAMPATAIAGALSSNRSATAATALSSSRTAALTSAVPSSGVHSVRAPPLGHIPPAVALNLVTSDLRQLATATARGQGLVTNNNFLSNRQPTRMSIHATSRQLPHVPVPPPPSVEPQRGHGQGLGQGLGQEIDYFATTNTSALTQPTFVPSSGDGSKDYHGGAPRGGRFFGTAAAAHTSSSSSSSSSARDAGLGLGTNGTGKKGGLSFELETTDDEEYRRDEAGNGNGQGSNTSRWSTNGGHTTPSRYSLDETMTITPTPAAATSTSSSSSHTLVATPSTTGTTIPAVFTASTFVPLF